MEETQPEVEVSAPTALDDLLSMLEPVTHPDPEVVAETVVAEPVEATITEPVVEAEPAAIIEPEPVSAEETVPESPLASIDPTSLDHSEAGCEFVERMVDGVIEEVPECELEEALPATEAAFYSDETEKVVVCNALTGQCDFVLVEAGHDPIANTELEEVPIEGDDGNMELRSAIIVDTEDEAAHYGLL